MLLILAAISIIMLTGDNSILKRAVDAKERTEKAQEEEKAKLVFTTIQMELAQGKFVDNDIFQSIIDNNFGVGNAKGNIGGSSYIITVNNSGKNYKMDINGNISELDEVPIDFAPGVLEGKGTEINPYVINSVEDLLAFAYNVNSKVSSYENEYVTLGRDLDLKDENSYVDEEAKYSLKKYEKQYNESYDLGYVPDETSNYSVINCMQGCYNGKAFISIGVNNYNSDDVLTCFRGIFDGCGHYIKNLDSRFEPNVGLFGAVSGNAVIKNVGIESGDIQSSGYWAAGILASVSESTNSNIMIDNCYNNARIMGKYSGGIVGLNTYSKLTVTNCYNSGVIIFSSNYSGGGVGGIVGYDGTSNNGIIINCFNTGDVISSSNKNCDAGGIYSYGSYQYIKNCYNSGRVTNSNGTAGGISGMMALGDYSVDSISQCYNFGAIYSENNEASGIACNFEGYNESIDNCYNCGDINSLGSTGISCGIITAVTGDVKVTNCHNTGKITNTASNFGEIAGKGTVDNSNDYMEKDANANANGAIPKSQIEMNEIMSVQNFVNKMNNYVEENNVDSSKIKLKKWKVENGLPVFEY